METYENNQDCVVVTIQSYVRDEYYYSQHTIRFEQYNNPERQIRFIRRILSEDLTATTKLTFSAYKYSKKGSIRVDTRESEYNKPCDVIRKITGYLEYAFHCMKFNECF